RRGIDRKRLQRVLESITPNLLAAPASICRSEDELGISGHGVDDLDRPWRQRHGMLLALLHALGGGWSHVARAFVPTCAAGFAGPSGRKDCDLERLGGRRVARTQAGHKFRRLLILQGLVMLYLGRVA